MSDTTSPAVVCLTDCTDTNAVGRLSARLGALFGQVPAVLPLAGPDPEAAAALTLLDTLRATESLGEPGRPTIVLVNIAPRDGRWPNGAPFCYFRHGANLVVSTLNHRVLELVRRCLGVTEVQVTDVREAVAAAATQWAAFAPDEVETIVTTQFRSLWYVPLLARWVYDGRQVPAHALRLDATAAAADAPPAVAVVDNFGNCKLDRPAAEVPGYSPGAQVKVLSRADGRYHEVGCYTHLTDVPSGGAGLITGSSGFGFAELVVRSGSAAERFGLREGTPIFG
jgi:hypothetical protein